MAITRDQRQQAEAKASDEQLFLYSEPESGEQLWNIALTFNITEKNPYRIFAQLVGDVVLGFYRQQDILALIQNGLPQLSPTQQLELELQVKKFLLPLSVTTESVQTLSVEIATTEHDLAALQNVRTMSHDMEVAQGHPVMQAPATETTYQSSQADILRPAAPAPVANETPRWDTE